MTKRPDNLLAAPAPRAAHRIALSLLDAATAARERLPDAGDAEALHDFRVAMRRLRSTLRARSEEHTSELQSLAYLVCRLLLEKKKYRDTYLRRQTPLTLALAEVRRSWC